MNKFLSLIKEQTPGNKIPTGQIPTGQGIKPQIQQNQPRVHQNKTSMGQIGSALRKIGSGFGKAQQAIASTKEFSAKGDFSVLKELGQQLINRNLDMDTYKISVFGKKNYNQVILIDKDLISKISMHGNASKGQDTSNESVNIMLNSGLLHENIFTTMLSEVADQMGKGIKPVQQGQNVSEFRFTISNEKNVGTMGKQYTLVPATPELESLLNNNDIKFVTFLREPNTSQENTFGNFSFNNNSGKLQFFDMQSKFIQSLEANVRFEYNAQEKVYKLGTSLSSHSFADMEENEKMLQKGILMIYPKDRIFHIISKVPTPGKLAIFRNIQTKQLYQGIYNPSSSPDKKLNFIVMTNVKPYNPQAIQQGSKPPAAKPATQPTVAKPTTTTPATKPTTP